MFSSVVKLANLDEFTNSQECTKPLFEVTSPSATAPNLIRPSHSSQLNPSPSDSIGKISVADCLACSGCVTSSEVDLLDRQSLKPFLKGLQLAKWHFLSISSQSLSALALHFNISISQVFLKCTTLFHQLGFQWVFDMSLSEELALRLSQEEFIEAHRRSQLNLSTQKFETQYSMDKQCSHTAQTISHKPEHVIPSLPILTSHCPGWIWYAEKTLSSTFLDHISRVKSSQLLQGVLVKQAFQKPFLAALQSAFPCPLLLALYLYQNSDFHARLPQPLNPSLCFIQSRSWPMSLSSAPLLSLFQTLQFKWILQYRMSISEPLLATSPSIPLSPNQRNILQSPGLEQMNSENRSAVRSFIEFPSPFFSSTLKQDDSFHTCIMPCYDKKLEVARLLPTSETTEKDSTLREVDTALVTQEVLELLNLLQIDFCSIPDSSYYDRLYFAIDTSDVSTSPVKINVERCPSLHYGLRRFAPLHGGSGAFTETVFRYASQKLYDRSFSNEPIAYQVKKNPDDQELQLDKSNQVVLKFSRTYGFQNIQNYIKKMRNVNTKLMSDVTPTLPNSENTSSGKRNVDYVEIMACPGGCLNGGGQPSPEEPQEEVDGVKQLYDQKRTLKARYMAQLKELESLYHSNSQTRYSVPDETYNLNDLEAMCQNWSGHVDPFPFHTTYHSLVKPDSNATAITASSLKW